MKNLGRIVTLLIILTNIVYANVTATIEPATVYKGDTVTYKLTIVGSDAKKPVINDICGNDITATGSQTSIQYINGDYAKSYILSYEFTPTKSCTIKPTKVEINSKVETSNSVNLTLKPRAQDLKADFVLSLEASKQELYVGEPLTVTLLLKQRAGAQAVDSKFIAPEFKGFWIKSESKANRTQKGDFIVTKVVYKLAPQREGNLNLAPAKLQIATRLGSNNWGTLIPQVKWRTYYSNELEIKVKAIPNGAKIIGNFTIKAAAKKLEVNPNEAVNVIVEIVGSGNLEDIEAYKPYIANVNVFDEKVVVKGDRLTQKLVFVGDKDFTIPPFELAFFNTKTDKVEKIKTEPIEVKVKGNLSSNKVQIKRDETPPKIVTAEPKEINTVVKVQNNYILLAISFVLGLLIGVSLMLFKRKSGVNRVKKFNIKDEKLLLMKLLPFKDSDAEVQKIVDILEHNIYSKEKQSLDKKLLKEIINRYDII